MKYSCPRVVLAGSGGDSGKTMLSIGLLSYMRRLGLRVNGFKKGPDFIDAAWLSQAAQVKARNLDVYLMGENVVLDSFKNHAYNFDINIIEGNRGIFDGMDADGSFSTAELAKLLQAPVVLILDATKVTRTLAAFVLGCLKLDLQLNIAGVVLNRVAGERHERVVRESIEKYAGIKVLGAIPKLNRFDLLPERHLGLVTPEEHGKINKVCEELGNIIEKYIDTAEVLKIAKSAPKLEISSTIEDIDFYSKKDVSVGYFQDSAFTFYYPENLEALEKSGAKLVCISPLDAIHLPELDALYIGGGFPETHADLISKNKVLLEQVKIAAEQGLPIYAECGGMIFLSHSLRYGNEVYPMANVLPFKIDIKSKPCGHGYCNFVVDQDNPFLPIGTQLKGHEFHYSTIVEGLETVKTSYNVLRGKGFFNKREGFVYKNVLAGYFHVHASSNPVWADSIIEAARKFKYEKKSDPILID